MNNKFSIITGVVAALITFAPAAQAIPITGTVIIQGGTTLTPVGSPLGTATGVAGTVGTVLAGSGSYSGTAATAVVFKAFTFQPAVTPVSSLWSFTLAGLTYTFDLTGMTVNTYSPSFLDIKGTGTLNITGVGSSWNATEGTWTYQINSTDPNGVGGVFSYQSSNTPIPDGGMTVILLGAALSGFYLFRKKTLA